MICAFKSIAATGHIIRNERDYQKIKAVLPLAKGCTAFMRIQGVAYA